MPNEKPIIFCTPMVAAILAGGKTQTRRVVKRKGYDDKIHRHKNDYAYNDMDNLWQFGYRAKNRGWPIDSVGVFSPYKPGDILWVRETWNGDWCDHVIYKADGGSAKAAGYSVEPKWRPSIHMQRAAARIFLRVTDMRVERLCNINENDLLAEGVEYIRIEGSANYRTYDDYEAACIVATLEEEFIPQWNTLNAKRGYAWDTNPWVWVISFERVDNYTAERIGERDV